MSEKLYKIVRYYNDCYCNKTREPLIVKYDASAGGTGIGTSNTALRCPSCNGLRVFRIDTWWGGSFKNSDYIFLDTAKRDKFKVNNAVDVTKSLLDEYIKTLDKEVAAKRRKLQVLEGNLGNVKAVFNRVVREERSSKKKKDKKRNG